MIEETLKGNLPSRLSAKVRRAWIEGDPIPLSPPMFEHRACAAPYGEAKARPRRVAPGECPMTRLYARLKAACDA